MVSTRIHGVEHARRGCPAARTACQTSPNKPPPPIPAERSCDTPLHSPRGTCPRARRLAPGRPGSRRRRHLSRVAAPLPSSRSPRTRAARRCGPTPRSRSGNCPRAHPSDRRCPPQQTTAPDSRTTQVVSGPALRVMSATGRRATYASSCAQPSEAATTTVNTTTPAASPSWRSRPFTGALATGLVEQPAGARQHRDPAAHERGRYLPQPRCGQPAGPCGARRVAR